MIGRTCRFAAVLGACVAGLAAGASAQTNYVGLRGGYTQPRTADLEPAGGPAAKIAFAGGPTAGLAVGFASHDGWRLEGELSWLRAEIETIAGAAAGAAEADAWTAMAGLYYGIDTGSAVTPYLGGGVGAARVSLSGVAGGGGIDDFDVVFAWQAAAGVDLRASEAITLSLECRYMSADGLRMRDAAGGRVATDFRSGSAVAGMRFNF